MKIIAATKNKNKLREFSEILKGFEIISQEEAGIDIDVEEVPLRKTRILKQRRFLKLREFLQLPTTADFAWMLWTEHREYTVPVTAARDLTIREERHCFLKIWRMYPMKNAVQDLCA